MINALKQAVQFGLEKKMHLAGAQQELEALEGLPPEARIGAWVMEWYWNQPGVPHVAEFVETIKKAHRQRPHGAHLVRPGLDLDLRAGRQQGQIAGRGRDGQGAAGFRIARLRSLCRRIRRSIAPDRINCSTRFTSATRRPAAAPPDDLFKVTEVVKGADIAESVADSGCKMTWPA